jgi:RNA recognition motif-containing protein
MEGATSSAGSSKKATIYVGGFAPEVNEQQLLDAFVTFGGYPCLVSVSRTTVHKHLSEANRHDVEER